MYLDLAAPHTSPPRISIRSTVAVVVSDTCTLSQLRVAAQGYPDGPARHLCTGRYTSRRAAETLTATEAAWFRPSAGGAS